jgi:hypothetical protein
LVSLNFNWFITHKLRIVILRIVEMRFCVKLSKLLALLESTKPISSSRISTRHENSTGSSASDPTREIGQSSAKLSQATRSRRAWDSRAISALGNTCCALDRKTLACFAVGTATQRILSWIVPSRQSETKPERTKTTVRQTNGEHQSSFVSEMRRPTIAPKITQSAAVY